MEDQGPTYVEITARACQTCSDSGCRHFHDTGGWLQAEDELMQMPVDELATLAVPRTSKARREVKSIIDVVRAAML